MVNYIRYVVEDYIIHIVADGINYNKPQVIVFLFNKTFKTLATSTERKSTGQYLGRTLANLSDKT